MPKPPATRKQAAANPLANIPSIDSALYANVGRYAGATVLTVFEQIGGVNRMAEWADENPGEFYTKMLGKVISSPKEVQVSGTVNFRQVLETLDLEAGKDYTDVEDAQVEEGDD